MDTGVHNPSKKYKADKIRELIESLSAIVEKDTQQISYSYTHNIIELVCSSGIEIKDHLLNILDNSDGSCSQGLKLVALYALCFYYKRYNKNDNLGETIERHKQLVNVHPLGLEIQSWYYRKNGQYNIAYSLDKQLIEKINIDINPVPYISFASSVAYMLEKSHDRQSEIGYSFWDNPEDSYRDWTDSCKYMDSAIQIYSAIRDGKKYGKHFSILGRLYAFYPKMSEVPVSKATQLLDNAIEQFSLAIQYENETSEDYFKRYEEYRQYQTKCAMIKLSIVSSQHSKEMEEKINELSVLQGKIQALMDEEKKKSLDSRSELSKAIEKEALKSDSLQNEMRQSINEQSAKSIEIVALFTAVIGIVLGGINILSSFDLITGMIYLFLLSSLCCMMVCLPALTMSNNKNRKTAIAMLIFFLISSFLILIMSVVMRVKGVI